MYCNQCGNEVQEGAKFCPGCGTSMSTTGSSTQQNTQNQTTVNDSTIEEKAPVNHYANSNSSGTYHQNHQSYNSPSYGNKYDTVMILSIVELVLCCLPAGIFGLISVNNAKNSYRSGDIPRAEQQIKNAKIALILGVVLPVVVGLFYLFIGMLSY